MTYNELFQPRRIDNEIYTEVPFRDTGIAGICYCIEAIAKVVFPFIKSAIDLDPTTYHILYKMEIPGYTARLDICYNDTNNDLVIIKLDQYEFAINLLSNKRIIEYRKILEIIYRIIDLSKANIFIIFDYLPSIHYYSPITAIMSQNIDPKNSCTKNTILRYKSLDILSDDAMTVLGGGYFKVLDNLRDLLHQLHLVNIVASNHLGFDRNEYNLKSILESLVYDKDENDNLFVHFKGTELRVTLNWSLGYMESVTITRETPELAGVSSVISLKKCITEKTMRDIFDVFYVGYQTLHIRFNPYM